MTKTSHEAGFNELGQPDKTRSIRVPLVGIVEIKFETIYGTLDYDTESKDVRERILSEPDRTHVAVVADILRATTTIAYLLDSGAKFVVASKAAPPDIVEDVRRRNERRLNGLHRGSDDLVYVPLGSDASGGIIYPLGNSPTEVIENRVIVNDNMPVIATTKGSVGIVNTAELPFDHVIAGSYPTLNVTAEYILKLASCESVKVWVVATEGKLAEDGRSTEDELFAQDLETMLIGDYDHAKAAARIRSCKGSSRFYKENPVFPRTDVDLAVAPPDSFDFIIFAHRHGHAVVLRAQPFGQVIR